MTAWEREEEGIKKNLLSKVKRLGYKQEKESDELV